jgi:hypothetical protein
MIVEYLISDGTSDIHLASSDLKTPFRISPQKSHPTLRLDNYFDAIARFMLKKRADLINERLEKMIGLRAGLAEVNKVIIRSEKHGAFYHLASAEFLAEGKAFRMAVSTAVSEKAKDSLLHEFETLCHLNGAFQPSYLPVAYAFGEQTVKAALAKQTLAIMLSEYLEDYHEWHFSREQKPTEERIVVWDQTRGNRHASAQESFEIFRQAARILTLYYDIPTRCQIYPWHHAAGDFIVKNASGNIDVRLCTAREYSPILDEGKDDPRALMIALVYFFFLMTLKMRLDRLDGTGQTVWANEFFLRATIHGFFGGMVTLARKGRCELGEVKNLLILLKSFREDEMQKLFPLVFHLLARDDPADILTIQMNLAGHISQLSEIIREFDLEGLAGGC